MRFPARFFGHDTLMALSPDDPTGNECSVNSFHLEDYLKKGMAREAPALAATAAKCTDWIAERLHKFSTEPFRIIISIKNRHCTLRFHRDVMVRHGLQAISRAMQKLLPSWILHEFGSTKAGADRRRPNGQASSGAPGRPCALGATSCCTMAAVSSRSSCVDPGMWNRSRAAWALVLIPACFHPTYDRPACGPLDECPGNLKCTAGVCEPDGEGDSDGGTPGATPDGSTAGDAPPDAPLLCFGSYPNVCFSTAADVPRQR